MMLTALVFLPIVGGFIALTAGRRRDVLARWISLATLSVGLILTLVTWTSAGPGEGMWVSEAHATWIPSLGIGFHLGMDGLSLVMVLLSYALGIAAVVASWEEITDRVGAFHLTLMATLSGVIGVFVAADLFLFYVFWELMLVPMYFLIAIWGHERRRHAAMKFAIFTQAGGLALLVAILGLYFSAGAATFELVPLLQAAASGGGALWIALCFCVAFAVKLPAVPLHVWLADAHTEAPTAGSVILAGLLLKTGGYGLVRFVWPLFPDAASQIAPVAMAVGVIGIIYGAVLAFAQTDLKRLVACSSVSHMGFVLLGVFAGNRQGLDGAVFTMICHGVATAALFIIVGEIARQTGTRDMRKLGGLWAKAPALSACAMVFALASLGLPGLGNFVGEFLVLLGTFKANVVLASVGACGMVFASIYALRMMKVAFLGPAREGLEVRDLRLRERVLMGAMILGIVLLGLFAKPTLDTVAPAIDRIQQTLDGGEVP